MLSFSNFIESYQPKPAFANKKKKGFLIVFEGIDGASKTTSSENLIKWLKEEKQDVFNTKWNSSDVMKDGIKQAKDKRCLSPMLFCLMHATDMVLRYEQEMVPALNKGKIVISDRYIYTSYVRDKARGIDDEILDKIYEGYREPNILFHCVTPIHMALARLVKRGSLSYYGTGSDLKLARSREDNYVKYETMIDRYYHKILPKVPGYFKLDTNRPPDEILVTMKEVIREKLGIH